MIILSVILVSGILFFAYNYIQENELEEFANTEANTMVTASTSIVTLEEISKHDKETDCWMAVNGTVVDVTSFVGKHPGGKEILKGCGKDASSYFNKIPGHLKGIAQVLVNKMKVGELAKQ